MISLVIVFYSSAFYLVPIFITIFVRFCELVFIGLVCFWSVFGLVTVNSCHFGFEDWIFIIYIVSWSFGEYRFVLGVFIFIFRDV